MWNNLIVSLSILAQLTGLTIPQIVEEGWYLVPSYTQQDYFYLAAQKTLPEIKERAWGPFKISDDPGPKDLEARSAMVQDLETGKVLYQKNPDEQLSIASLTKLMTVLVFMEYEPADGLEHVHTLDPGENALAGARLQVDNLDQVTGRDLLRSTLVGSTNNGALALAHSTEMSDLDYVAAMNDKAKELGMEQTVYTDQTGLDAGNKSTARDLMKLFRRDLEYFEIAEPLGMSEYYLETLAGEKMVKIKNTNPLLKDTEIKVTAGKTGFTYEAGYCLIVQAEDGSGHKILALVLNEPSEEARSSELKGLINWAFNNYQWN